MPNKFKEHQKVEKETPKFRTPSKTKGTDPLLGVKGMREEDDLTALLDGAEDWDWSDMMDFVTPKKGDSKNAKPTPGGLSPAKKPLPQVPKRGYKQETCTRCIVESISEVHVNGRLQKVRRHLLGTRACSLRSPLI
jgi:DNA replication ATP-dependent helicase Dna2